ncbi:Hypothetical predicted protein [Olea europaea subsp. europaea]|uniref:Uncharacterized protein n=1 Tax=Olea europaea subsp. europaea TaxID=158383 RepID=A0A8S0SXG3_OLEEU|nr:Hypothetical predicted protein [Olea europaea subsp. europaea]
MSTRNTAPATQSTNRKKEFEIFQRLVDPNDNCATKRICRNLLISPTIQQMRSSVVDNKNSDQFQAIDSYISHLRVEPINQKATNSKENLYLYTAIVIQLQGSNWKSSFRIVVG